MSISYGPMTGASSTNTVMYDAKNVRSYPGSGTTIYDLYQTQNTSLLGGASYTTFASQPCFNSAVEGYYTTPGSNSVLISNYYTYSSWCNIKASAGTWRTLFRTNPNQHPLLVQNDDTIGFYDNTGTGYNIFTGALATAYIGNWAYWVVVGNGLTVTLYINGVQAGSSVTVGVQTYTASGNYHGEWGAAAGSQSFGYIATMELIPNAALTADQILIKFNALRGRYGI